MSPRFQRSRFQRSLGTLLSFAPLWFALFLGLPSAFADEAHPTIAPPTIAPATTSAAEATSSAGVAQDPASTPPSLAPPTAKPLRMDGPDGTYIRLGLLLQPQLQAMGSPTLDGYATNLYIRRTRILLGGSLLGKVDFFLDTDYPNLFLSSNTAAGGAPNNYVKNTPGMNIQDVFVTYKPMGEVVKVDVGYMLPALGHNALQGATTLYGLDYFSYSFQHSNSFGTSSNPIGRDLGVQLRGLVLDGLLEYRLGLFQGLRLNRTTTEMEARNFFRVTGRVQVNLLDAETAFFYQGTYLGTKRVASVGASYDFQDDYKYFAVDGFVDLPLGPGLVTGQVNLAHWNGGTTIPGLAEQTAVMGEAGYAFAGLGINPIVRIERLWNTGALPDQTRLGGGVAYWPYGHNTNLKAFYSHVKNDGADSGYHQFNLQWQIFFY